MTLNRVVAVVAAVLSLALALLPVIANFDATSTAGVIAGIGGILGVTLKWLEGWQKHEDRVHGQKVKLDVTTDETEDADDLDDLEGVKETDPVTLPPDSGDKGKV